MTSRPTAAELVAMIRNAQPSPCSACGGTGRPPLGDTRSLLYCACFACDGSGNAGLRPARALAQLDAAAWLPLAEAWERLRGLEAERVSEITPERCG